MEIDDLLDTPIQARNPSSGFDHKGGKFKPRPKTVPSGPPNSSLELVKKEQGIGITTDIDFNCIASDMDVDMKPMADEVERDYLMDTETEDEVVREIDVYFVPSLDRGTQIYWIQFPLREKWRPYELDDRCQAVRVKPESRELEIDLRIDVNSKNYDSDADPRLQIEKQTLTTVWKQQVPRCSYSVGILNENKLHLHPIHAVVQLRPSMQHLDSKDSGKKAVAKVVGDKAISGAATELKKLVWVPLKYHPGSSDLARKYIHLMTTREGPPINFSMSSSDYMTSLFGTPSNTSDVKAPPRRSLQNLPLKERFKTYFLEGHPIYRFESLKCLAPDESVEEVFVILQELARLVQGHWVPKSSLICGAHEGNEALARDYVLLLFSKNIYIKDSQLPQQRPGLYKAMKVFLNIFAVERRVLSDWKLREPPNMEFTKLYPSVVKQQEEEWGILEKKINNSFVGSSKLGLKAISKPNASSNQATAKLTPKVASPTLVGRSSSRFKMPEEAQAAIAKTLQKLFKRDKVCSYQQIGELLRGMVVSECQKESTRGSAIANMIDKFPDEFKAIIDQLVVNIHGVGVLKSSPDHPEYDSLRKFVIDYFMGHDSQTKLKRAVLLEAAKAQLKREISKTECDKVLQELCISQGSLWILKGAEGNSLQ